MLGGTRLFALCACVVVASCKGSGSDGSDPDGGAFVPGVSQSVGPAGGTLIYEGVTLEIPPGALDDAQTISIGRSKDAPPDGVTPLSPIYEFAPEGLHFRLPVTVTIAYEGGAEDAVVYWSDGSGGFDQSGQVGLVAENAVTTDELHFSGGFVGHLSKMRLMPCDNTDNARKKRSDCSLKPGDICLDNGIFPIQYVFVLMQENRSFDNYFGRFQAYLQKQGYTDARTKPGGVEVPATPYELRDAAGKAAEDAKVDLCTYDPKKDAPWNPPRAGAGASGACDKHYWRHASGPGEQCVSDTCHEWWCSHLQVDGGRMDGFFQSNDGFWEGGTPDVGRPPPKPPADWYDRTKHPNEPDDGTLLRGDRAMLYYDQRDIPFYYWVADAFGIADHYHSSVIGPTWVNRDFLYAGTSRGLTSNASDDYGNDIKNLKNPPNIWAGAQTADPPVLTYTLPGPPGEPPKITALNTIYDALDIRHVGYTQWVRNRYNNGPAGFAVAKYGAWYPYITGIAADSHKYHYDNQYWTGGGQGFEKFVREENAALEKAIAAGKRPDLLLPQGHLFPVNFIDPDIQEDVDGEDEHPPGTPQMGQRLTYDVVRVLMSNPEVWKRSVLFITWDEHGGFYDHVAPPKACEPDNVVPKYSGPYAGGPNTAYSDEAHTQARGGSPFVDNTDTLYNARFDQYGVRVPLLVISPWAKHQYVSHNTYDHTSIIRFIEARFHLPALTNRDANADPLFDLFDFSLAPQKLRGEIKASPDCIACSGMWGTEKLPTGPDYEDAALLGTVDSSDAIRFQATANAECRRLFPPDPKRKNLGAKVYGPYDWSRGIKPPGPVACGPGPGTCSSCTPTPCPLSNKWCRSECKCEKALECPPGDFMLGGCECCFQWDTLDPSVCIVCDSKQDVFATYCPAG